MKSNKKLISAALFGGMILLAVTFTLQGYLPDDLIAYYRLDHSAKGLAGAAAWRR